MPQSQNDLLRELDVALKWLETALDGLQEKLQHYKTAEDLKGKDKPNA